MKKSIVAAIIACMTMNVSSQIKVDCIGNSITSGYGLSNAWLECYPSVLQTLLGTTGYTVQNDGVISTTMLKNGDNPYWKNGKLSQAFTFQPNIVVIKLGTNDTKPQNWDTHGSEFKSDYLAMIDTISSMNSKPKIYVVLPVPVFYNATTVSWGIRDSIIQKEIPIIKEVASERGLTVIDCYTPLLQYPQFFSVDGIHPDAAGADTIAHIVYRAITASTPVEISTVQDTRALLALSQKVNALSITIPLYGASTVQVFDINGKQLKSVHLNSAEAFTMSTLDWPNGVYVLRLSNRALKQAYCHKVNITQ